MADNQFIIRKGYIALEDSQITGSLSVTNSVTASFFTGSFKGDGSQLSGVSAGFPFTGSATISGSLQVTGSVSATAFIGDGSQLTGIADPTPITATINNTNSPFTITSQSIVIIDSTNGDVTVNLPDLDLIDGTPDQKPILLYKNDYSQNVIYVEPSGSQLVNGTTQDIIVSIQIAIAYNPTSAGWVTEGTSYQSLAELELFFVPRTETGSFATTGSNQFSGSQAITGSLTVTGNITGNITGSASTASYVEYANVANKPAIVSGSSQISFNGITDKPTLVSGSSQITYSGLTGIPSGILSGSAQIASFGIFATTGSNQFNGNQSITGSLTVSGQVVAQTLNVQQVTSSIVYSSGSNIFGNSVSNTQQFTGSLQVSGSSHYLLGSVGVGVTSPLSRFHVNTGTNQNFRVRPGTDVGATNGVALNSRTDDDGSLQQLTLRASDVVMLTSGNVGIGTASPGSILQANFSNATTYSSGVTGNGLTLYNTSATNNQYVGLYFLGEPSSGNAGQATIYGITTGTGAMDLAFSTRGSSVLAERLRITSGGNVGIGATSPSATLDIGSGKNLSGTDPISVYTDVRVASAVTGGLIGYNVRMVALAGSYTVANMYGIKTNTAVVQSGVTVTNSYGVYIGRTDDPSSGGVVTNKYALVTEATAGNVGIGTTTPSINLQISGTNNNGVGSSTFWSFNFVGQEITNLSNTANTVAGLALVGGSSRSSVSAIGNILESTTLGALAFFTGGSGIGGGTVPERMRITSGGDVCIASTAPVSSRRELRIGGNASGSRISLGLNGTNYSALVTDSGGNVYLVNEFNDSAIRLLMINFNNGVYLSQSATSWTSNSDERLKNINRPIENAVDKLNTLRAVNFSWKNDNKNKENFGLIAQDVEKVFPEVMDKNTLPNMDENKDADKTEYLGVRYQELIPVLVKAIQEQQSQIEILKAEIQTLKQ